MIGKWSHGQVSAASARQRRVGSSRRCQLTSLQKSQIDIYHRQCFEEEGGVIEVHDDLDSLLAVRSHLRRAETAHLVACALLKSLPRPFAQVVPPDVRETLVGHPLRSDLLEIIMDLGRAPEARFLVRA